MNKTFQKIKNKYEVARVESELLQVFYQRQLLTAKKMDPQAKKSLEDQIKMQEYKIKGAEEFLKFIDEQGKAN